jgi:hypothetical protein
MQTTDLLNHGRAAGFPALGPSDLDARIRVDAGEVAWRTAAQRWNENEIREIGRMLTQRADRERAEAAATDRDAGLTPDPELEWQTREENRRRQLAYINARPERNEAHLADLAQSNRDIRELLRVLVGRR